jgi:hypothetical protein
MEKTFIILPNEKFDLTDDIKTEILNVTGKGSHNKIAKNYAKYFHCFEDIINTSIHPIAEILYILRTGKTNTCKHGGILLFRKKHGYTEFCGSIDNCICKQKDYKIRSAKRDKTNIEKYGTENPMALDFFKDKIKKTNIEKYGTEHHMRTKESKEKVKKTNIERYGHENPLSSPKIREKIKKTNISLYGTEHAPASVHIQEKIKKTLFDNYGVHNPMDSDIIRNKLITTNLEKIGVDYPLQSSDIHKKIKDTFSEKYDNKHPKQQNYSDIAVLAFNDRNVLQSYVNEFPIEKLEELFNCESTTIYRNINKHDVDIPFRNDSSYERAISQILTENNIDHTRQDRSVIPPLEIDIYIPSVKLAIEVNGLYWHSEKFKDKNYHYNKWKSCHDKDIQLLSIMEDEFIERPNTWISKILHICNQSKDRIHARKCEVKEVYKDEVKSFVEQYHLQGFALARYYYGAYYDNELVAMMSFANTRNNKEIQMNRFCLKNGIVISGIANRLLKAFYNDHDVSEIVTYSDNRYSNGGIYRQLGFEMMNEVRPDYSYIKGSKRYHKSNFKKSNIESKFGIDMTGKTERQTMEELGFLRIYDCGKIKWKWSKSS